MILTLTPARRLFLVILALTLVPGVSYFSIRTALASYYASQGTLEGDEKAVHLEPSNPEYWVRLGDFLQTDLQDADSKRAIQAYRRALSLNPNSTQAWLGLASVYEAEGELNAVNEALLNAKRSYPLSADVCWRYANFLLRVGDLNSAFAEARYAVEQEPRRTWEAFALFQRFDSDVSRLVDRLLPSHEGVYLDVIWGLEREGRPGDALTVWDRLFALDKQMPEHAVPAGNYQVTQVILFSLVEQLLSTGYISDAGRVWDEGIRFLKIAPRHEPPESLVWDGGFETETTGGLSWHLEAATGSEVRFSQSVKHTGARALEIKFDGKHNVDFHGTCQAVVVNPDVSYDFSAWLRTENITTDSGIFFRLSTPEGRASDVMTPQITGTHPWTNVFVPWKAAKGVRLLRICVVRTPSYNLYNQIAGTAWVDDVQLTPVVPPKSSDMH